MEGLNCIMKTGKLRRIEADKKARKAKRKKKGKRK